MTLATWAVGATVSSDVGNSWLKIPSSTRNAAMGEALGAVPDATDAVDINPAGLGVLRGIRLSLAQNFWAQDISIQHFTYGSGFADGEGIALGADCVNFGKIPLYHEVGSSVVSDGNYSPMGLNLYGGYGMKLSPGLFGGVAAHLIYDNTQKASEGSTGAIDVGLMGISSGAHLSGSAVLSNVGGKLNDEKLPSQLKTAVAYRFEFPKNEGSKDGMVLAAEGDWGMADTAKSAAGFGAEYCFAEVLSLQCGYRVKTMKDIEGLKGFSCGVGFERKFWGFNYAMTTIGDFGKAHQIELNFKWGDKGDKPKTVRSDEEITVHKAKGSNEVVRHRGSRSDQE